MGESRLNNMKHLYGWDILGHDRIIAELEKEIASGNVSHAYLFAGPDQVGKFSVARTMAHILQCEGRYCHDCHVCREIDRGCHADTIEIIDNGDSIKIEEIRDIIARLHMSGGSPYKILLIQNIERMPVEAANAMLKTLEDPPEGVLFLLTTDRVKDILPTIISRVRVYNFQKIPERKILELLQSLYPLADTDLLTRTASYAMGRPGRAVNYMREPLLLEQARKMYNDISLFVKKPDRVNEFVYVAELVKTAQEAQSDRPIKDFLDTFAAVLRQKLLEGADGSDEADSAAQKRLAAMIREIMLARDLLKRNVNTRLLLENLMLHL